ncbi:hypothetical protein SAMN00120144_3285 [Hymenobacter roseosalivarius DSM 11622]|uniref:Uncharacterized protein n=1 Tax=Hymenobacter roseosalivarius DSM 11622 TaxID=645990 RepID=A0A1W1V9R5_9BACT|nr:hypothetical protein SAMN00120144_3285 [Hymenobacter roseosalivarius DSM 11622]
MNTVRLTFEGYNQTFEAPMREITRNEEELLDIWPYIESIPATDLEGFEILNVLYVYRNASNLFEHILIGTENENVFLVIIIHIEHLKIHGHYLLNVVKMYGLTE